MRVLSLIYNHRVPGFKETQIGFDPHPEKESEFQKESQNASVGRLAGRPQARFAFPFGIRISFSGWDRIQSRFP